MGIRGLTTFIARSSEKFLESHQLHDTNLVLDGNNICCQLFNWHVQTYDCFGGDYDVFARLIESFFETLLKCNIVPIVVFDGNYEWKKLKTVFSRHEDRIKTAGMLTPATESSCKVFPLFTRTMFAEIVKRLGIHVYRCELEADNELACLARALNCPVLSFDSDFYIFDVLYVPFNSLNFDPSYDPLRKAWYLDCKLYRTEHFLRSFQGLRREHLPLIATLLGNDYIKASVFSRFYSQLKLKRSRPNANIQQRRIHTVIQWLRTETFESAVCKILNRLKMCHRRKVAKKIDIIVKGYICCDSVVLKDLNIKYTPDRSRRFELNYNLDDLIKNCDKVGNLQTSQSDIENSEKSEAENDEAEIAMSATLGISEEETDDKQDKAVSSNAAIPTWFVKKHNLCEYPPIIYEIAHAGFFFCTPQVEDYKNKPSHSICFGVLSVINKILSQAMYRGQERLLVTVGRNDSNRALKATLPSCDRHVLSLKDIPNLTAEWRLDFMLEVLELPLCKDALARLPDDWKLLMLCIFFWFKNATMNIQSAHAFSVFLCTIVLKIVDPKIGPIRNLTKLRTRYCKLLEKPNATVKRSPPDSPHIGAILNSISLSEAAFTMLSLIPNFSVSDKIAKNHKQFDIRIVDAFAQLQCCILYIGALNYLLNEPLQKLIVSDFYNGIFLYNLCANLNRRSDIGEYLRQFLPNSPNVVNACLKLEDLLGTKVEVRNDKKRRKRKKVSKSNDSDIETNVQEAENRNDDSFLDENNAFSILSRIE